MPERSQQAATQARPPVDLTERQRAVLRAVVEDYVLSAVPVGSRALVRRYGLNVSPATIRSAMADLEALGLLTHPHTSAGRVPSDLGYRYYVEALMRESELDRADTLMIRHQFSQVQLTSNDWLRLAASTLAASTRAAAVVTPARSRRAKFAHLQLVDLADRARMAVVVLTDGTVVERHLDPAALTRAAGGPASQEDLDAAAAELNAELTGLTAPQARRRGRKLTPLAAHVAGAVAEMLEEADGTSIEEVFTDGLAYVLDQPEFAGGTALRPVLEVLQHADFLEQLLPMVTRRGGVHVIIGRENPNDAMREVSLIFAPYGTPERALGLLGVLGPTRMAYPRAIPTVRFVSTVLNDLIDSHSGWTHD
ncbi:MAG TPA: heat-inducible transcriptional repressor HrcA [Candidatus Limnocylindria bacterium]|nr:heat-inducible transcriptional repressor HrcA [Candidatus Limnocylindria bacterium]